MITNNKNNNRLIEAFKQAIDYELEVINIIEISGIPNVLIFYHIQQAFEKLLKVLYLEMSLTNNVNFKIKNKGHRIEDISFELIVMVGEEHIKIIKKLHGNDPQLCAELIQYVENFKQTVKYEGQIAKDNFVNNFRNYELFFNNLYDKFEQYKNIYDKRGGKPIIILAVGGLLTLALYRMNNIPRYPEEDFDYENLSILKSNIHLSTKLLKMFRFWFDLVIEHQVK